MTSLNLPQNSFILRTSIKIAIMFIIVIFNDSQETLKESEIMYYNAIYICIFWYNKSCWFSVKKCWCQQNLRGVLRNLNIFWIFFIQGTAVLSFIIVKYGWQLLWKVRFFAFYFIFYSWFIFTIFEWDKVKMFSQSILIR